MKRIELFRHLALTIEEKLYDYVVETEETEGTLVEIFIEDYLFEVDFKASVDIKYGMKSTDYDTPDDYDELEVDVYEFEIRSLWNDNKLLTNVRNQVNNEIYKLLINK